MADTQEKTFIYGSSVQAGYNLSDLRRDAVIVRGLVRQDSVNDGLDVAIDTAEAALNAVESVNNDKTVPLYRISATRFGPTKVQIEAEYRNVFTNNQPSPPQIAARVDYSTSVEYVNVYTVPSSASGITSYLPEVTGPDIDYHMADGPRTISLSGSPSTTTGSLVEPQPYRWPVPTVRIAVAVSLGSNPPTSATVLSVGKVNSGTVTLLGQTFTARTLRFDGIDVELTIDENGNSEYVGVYKYTAAAHLFKAHAVTAEAVTLATGEESVVYTVSIIDLHEQIAPASFPLP